MPAVALTMGNVHYEKVGPENGRPVVLIHGYAMGGSLWRPLTERLAAGGFRCFAPTWPLGAHTEPMNKDAELTIEAIAAMVGELLDTLCARGRRLGRQRHRRRDRPGRRDQHADADRGTGPDELRRVRALPAANTEAVHRGRQVRAHVSGARSSHFAPGSGANAHTARSHTQTSTTSSPSGSSRP